MNGKHVGMSALLQVVVVCGIVAFACSGYIEARHKEMDLVGVFFVVFFTAFGGGTLRDLLLDRRPLFWVEHQEYTLAVFFLVLIVTPFFRHLRSSAAERAIIVADALGLGLFSVVGTSVALEAKMPVFVCAMMGVTTAIFGGILRDVLCNEIPLVFRRGQLYATCSFVGCWVYLGLDWFRAPQPLALRHDNVVILIMRLLAVRFDLRLPG